MKQMTRNVFLVAIAAMAAMTLTACGGGGDSGDVTPTDPTDPGGNPTTPALTITVGTQLPAKILEGSEGDYSFTVNGAQNGFSVTTTPTVTGGTATVRHSTDGNKVTVTINAVDIDYATAAITNIVTITDGNKRQVMQTSKTVLQNTTAEPVIAQISGSAVSIKSFAEGTQALAVVNKLSEISMLMGEVASVDYGKEFQSAVNNSAVKAALLAWSTNGPNLVTAYSSGQIGEVALNDAMTDVLNKAQQHSQAGSQVLADVISLASGAVGNFAVTGVYVNPVNYGLSMFEGNPTLGAYQDGVWKFAAPVSFLAAIVGTDANMCSVN